MKKKTLWLVAAAVLVLAALIVIRLSTRTAVPEGTIRLERDGTITQIDPATLTLTDVHGTVVNGKGEEKPVDGKGILLADLLAGQKQTGFSRVTAVADDEYSADVTAEEIARPDKVWLVQQEDGSFKLVVFGDSNSKRNVSDVRRLVIS